VAPGVLEDCGIRDCFCRDGSQDSKRQLQFAIMNNFAASRENPDAAFSLGGDSKAKLR
jgi:hypothetical protein